METANTLNLLCYIFGDHYGSSFNILNTPIHFEEIDTIKTLVELGELSPEEIHEKIIQRHERTKIFLFSRCHKHKANIVWVKDYFTHPDEIEGTGCKWNLKGYYYTLTIQNNNFVFANGKDQVTSKHKRQLHLEINKIKKRPLN